MKRNYGGVAWQLPLFSSLAVSGILVLNLDRTLAQVTPDNTLGNENSVVNAINSQQERIDGGATRGANLFHSFQDFNVLEGRGVYFANPDGIENIFSRVTGNNRSEILGTLGVNGAANLFLINPNGILFGENAALDVQGSFAATSADGIEFGDRGSFSVQTPESPKLLTINPSAFLFNQVAPGAIVNNSRASAGKDPGGVDVFGLRVPNGKSLLLVGGNVSMDGGWAIASGGRIELGGLTEAGSVGIQNNGSNFSLSFPDGVQRGDISLTNRAIVGVTADGGGSIAANARNLEILAGSEFFAGIGEGLGTANTQAGDITVNATGQIKLAGTDSLIFNSVQSQAVGNAGNVTIKTGSLSVTDGGEISSSTFGRGDSGNISITADNAISLDASSYIVNNVQSSDAEGNAGKIGITTGSLSLTNGAEINSFTRGQGNAGDITIQARDAVTFDGVDSNENYSGLFTNVEADAVGSGGDINIQAKDIFVRDGGEISSSTYGKGDSGNIYITADNAISLDAASLIYNNVQSSDAEGNAGKIDITTGSLSLTNGSQINSFTRGQGNAGDITIGARNAVSFDDIGVVATGVDAGAVGDAGNVDITAGTLSLTNGSQIDSSTLGKGNGGNITIGARDTVSFDGLDSNRIFTGVIAGVGAGAVGDGGNVNITARSLSLTNRGALEVKVRGETDTLPGGQGKGGILNVNVSDALTISGSDSLISGSLGTGAVGRGGEIKIQAGNVFLKDGGQIDAFTDGKGDSGNIFITASDAISIDRSIIANLVLSSEAEGNAGKIDVTTDSLSLTNGSQITSLTRGQGNAGDINIQARETVTFDGFQFQDNRSSISYTGVLSSVDSGAVGNGGNINITTGSLSLTNGGELNASISEASDPLPGGKGQGGSVNINVDDTLTIAGANTSGIFASLGAGAVGSGGDINIQAGSLVVKDGGEINSSTFGQGDSGNIFITADNAISLDLGGIYNNVQSREAEGNAGKIDITTGSLSVTNGAQINSFTRGQGNGGNITIQATDTVTFDGVDSNGSSSGLNTSVEAGANGDGGTINITAGSFFLTNLAKIFSTVDGRGNGGGIFIEARDLVSLVGVGDVNLGRNAFINTADGSIISSSVNFGGEGEGGDITINAGGSLRLDSSQINTSTAGKGDSGNIIINARDSVDLLQGSDMFAEVTCACEEQGGGVGGIGDGGDIQITTGSLLLDIGASLRADTEASGNGGNITIDARDSVTFRSDISTLIGGALSQVEPFAVGQGGDIKITTGTLSLSGYQEINTRTQGQGNAGNIFINANSISVAGSDVRITSSASQEDRLPGTSGDGGDIDITAGSLFINDGAKISANTEILGNAGNININLLETLEANNGEISTSSTQSSGGVINIAADNINLRGNSDIISNVFSGAGGGGNINITADSVIAFDDSDIFAFARDGRGGNINLNTPAYFGNSFTLNSFQSNPDSLNNNARADINATGAVSGVVSIPDASFIQNSLADLPDNAINTENLIANSCVVRSRKQEGKFIITGADGLPESPTDNSISPYPTGEVRLIPKSDRAWQKGDPIVEPQGVYKLENGKAIVSRECSQ